MKPVPTWYLRVWAPSTKQYRWSGWRTYDDAQFAALRYWMWVGRHPGFKPHLTPRRPALSVQDLALIDSTALINARRRWPLTAPRDSS